MAQENDRDKNQENDSKGEHSRQGSSGSEGTDMKLDDDELESDEETI